MSQRQFLNVHQKVMVKCFSENVFGPFSSGRVIPDYAQIPKSLRELMGKGATFRWLPEHQFEFEIWNVS